MVNISEAGVSVQLPNRIYQQKDKTLKEMKKIIFLLIISGFWTSSLKAQWHGGSGQGYSKSTIINDQILPVTWNRFEAVSDAPAVNLIWETATETDNDYFEIEHSLSGKEFKTVGRVTGHGTVNTISRYEFKHLNPVNGLNYYRLKQVDFDGQSHYSDVISVWMDLLSESIRLFTNPTQGKMNIAIPREGDFRIRIYDTIGNEVYSTQLTGGIPQSIETDGMPRGLYYLVSSRGGREISEKFLVK